MKEARWHTAATEIRVLSSWDSFRVSFCFYSRANTAEMTPWNVFWKLEVLLLQKRNR